MQRLSMINLNQKDNREYSANTQKARELIGFVPQIKLKEGLKNTIEWYRTETLRK